MLFSSMTFLWVFLPVTFLLCLVCRGRCQNGLLVAASLLFYAWGEPRYVILIMISIVLNWALGLFMDRTDRHKKAALALAVVVNLAVLGYYKYFDFLTATLNRMAGRTVLSERGIALPIGISFFTFQILSYLIDLYRGKYRAQKNIVSLALYISFFPQLIAGPIVKYRDISEQIKHRTMTAEGVALGLRRFVYGLGKKVLIANVLAECVDSIYNMETSQIGCGAAWIAAVFYALQIYYDFSGYSDMAIGLGKMFGFTFQENFRYPYLSGSVQEFWQRWHISLGSWFKEYVYIPLGGNQKRIGRTCLNLLLVFGLTGLWHGASWGFVFWGLFHGMFQVLERLGWKRILDKNRWIGHIYTLLVVLVGWVFFRAGSFSFGCTMLVRMFEPWKYAGLSGLSEVGIRAAVTACAAIFGCGVLQASVHRLCPVLERWKYSGAEMIFCAFVLVFSFMSLAGNSYNPFIYFRF